MHAWPATVLLLAFLAPPRAVIAAEPSHAAAGATRPDTKSSAAKAEKPPNKPAEPKRSASKAKETERERSSEAKAPDAKAAGKASSKASRSAARAREPEHDDATESPSDADTASVDPRRGRGERHVEIASEGTKSEPRAAATGKSSAESSAARSTSPHRIAPPKGPPRSPLDMTRRRVIAQGPTSEDLAAGKDDAELRSLREAELVLFPRPLPGFTPGWTWDLPKAVDPELPEIITGAPPSARASLLPREPASNAEWVRALTMPNIPVRLEDRVIRYLSFYRDTQSGRSIGRAWAKKSGRYVAALKAELAKAGLPTDLVWLSLIESGHNPTIVSPAGAAGIWQFMPDAGRAYGLAIDRWVDERLDPLRSTEAACRFLSDLYRRFGSWDLAMAAYNMGHGGLSRAIRKYNTNDFWELSRYEAGIPWETAIYVPKIMATAIAMTNRRALGFDDVAPDPPEPLDTVVVGAGVLLSDIARLANVPVASLEAMNPQYLAGRTPPCPPGAPQRSWPVRVPSGTVAQVRQALARQAPSDEWFVPYVVRVGDTVESIAQARAATEAQIRALNRVDPKEVLAPGTVLLVPRSDRASDDEIADAVVVVPPRSFRYADRRRVFYRVLAGDGLGRIGEAFGVSRSELLLWNALDESARLYPGMTLQIYVNAGKDLSGVRYATESKSKILVAGSPEFFDYFEGQLGRRRFVVRAKDGDSLAAIGKRYGSTVGSMERINRRSRNDTLAAGEPVVVYTERTRPLPGDALYVDPREAAVARRNTAPAPAGGGAAVSASRSFVGSAAPRTAVQIPTPSAEDAWNNPSADAP